MRPKKLKRPKAVAYVLIPEKSDIGRPMYEQLFAIVDEYHQELSASNVRIALAWSLAWKPDVDGRLTLGKCKKASDLDRELAPYDFVILLNRDFWQNPRFTDLQRKALLDHELLHAAIAYDENGEGKVDERGRTVYRIRKHDLEEFSEIASRYGCWKKDIEDFARALARAEHATKPYWVGFTSLRDALKDIGLDVPVETIATWPDVERLDVLTWTRVRQEADVRQVNINLCANMPACLAAAVISPPSEETAH